MYLAGGWIVLDQLDELVAEHDLAARHRDGFADDEIPTSVRLLAGGQQAHPVAVPVLPAECEIFATTLESLLQHFGIGRGEVGWRQRIEHLPHGELDDRLVLRRHAAHAGRGVVPPLLSQKKRLGEQVERRSFPLRPGKAPILRLRLDQGPGSLTGREVMQRRFKELARAPQGVLRYLHLPLRRRRQMRKPVDIGKRQRDRRDAAGQPRQHRMECAIGPIRLERLPLVSVGSAIRTSLAWDDGAAVLAITRGMRGTGQPRSFSFRQGRYRLHGIHLYQIAGGCTSRP